MCELGFVGHFGLRVMNGSCGGCMLNCDGALSKNERGDALRTHIKKILNLGTQKFIRLS